MQFAATLEAHPLDARRSTLTHVSAPERPERSGAWNQCARD